MKPKREISFGEWQDECAKHHVRPKVVDCSSCDERIKSVCKQHDDGKYPCGFDLTDPPRFTEAQMALLRAWHNIGAKVAIACVHDNRAGIAFYNGSVIMMEYYMGFATKEGGFGELDASVGIRIDLAELFGKEETK